MQFDVLVITALFDELSEVLALTDNTSPNWQEDKDSFGFAFITVTSLHILVNR